MFCYNMTFPLFLCNKMIFLNDMENAIFHILKLLSYILYRFVLFVQKIQNKSMFDNKNALCIHYYNIYSRKKAVNVINK